MIHVDSRDIVRLQKALRQAETGKDQIRAMNVKLRKIANPIADDVRRAALKLPAEAKIEGIKRTKKSGALSLRRGIAGAVEVRVGSSARTSLARIRVSGSRFRRLTGKPATLPRYMEGLSRKKWRHPVFADKGVGGGTWAGAWAEQDPHPYLLPTVLPHKTKVRDQIVETYLDALEVQIREQGLPVRHY